MSRGYGYVVAILLVAAACSTNKGTPSGGGGGGSAAGGGGSAAGGGGGGSSGGADLAMMTSVDSGSSHDMSLGAHDAATTSDAGSCVMPSSGTRTAPPFGTSTVTTSGLLVRVMNNCSFPLWIHGQGNDGAGGTNTLAPDNKQLAQGQEQDYDAKTDFGSARVTAYKAGPGQNEAQFVEMNYVNGQLGYNVSYVDYLGLPVEVTATCGTTACYAPLATILDGCPSQLATTDRCVSPDDWCNDPTNAATDYCKVFDTTAQQALQLPQCQTDLKAWLAKGNSMANVGTTPSVYACKDFWSSSSFCCAVVNRGVVSSATPTDPCGFYKNPPYNTYSKWVHEKCPMIYSFPYDDAAGQSGYHQCNTNELRITWCPGG
jgi:hypothetical protein